MEEKKIMAKCTCCGAELPIEHLGFLPETEEFYRKLPSKTPPKGVDPSVLLCPNCLMDWELEHKDRK